MNEICKQSITFITDLTLNSTGSNARTEVNRIPSPTISTAIQRGMSPALWAHSKHARTFKQSVTGHFGSVHMHIHNLL